MYAARLTIIDISIDFQIQYFGRTFIPSQMVLNTYLYIIVMLQNTYAYINTNFDTPNNLFLIFCTHPNILGRQEYVKFYGFEHICTKTRKSTIFYIFFFSELTSLYVRNFTNVFVNLANCKIDTTQIWNEVVSCRFDIKFRLYW